MFRVTADNVSQKRTLRPLYAQTQATPYAGFLDPAWETTTADILPGMVCRRAAGDLFSPVQAAADVPVGLAALFVAPKLKIDEVSPTGTGAFTVWVGDNQSLFEVLAPAFDTSATWVAPTAGQSIPLYGTTTAHAQGPGKLTNVTTNATTTPVAYLVDVVGTNKIIVQLSGAPAPVAA